MIFGIFLHLVAGYTILFSKNLKLTLIMIMAQGFAMGGRGMVGFCWTLEHCLLKHASSITAIMFSLDSLAICISSLYFKNLSKDWSLLYTFPLIILSIDLLFILCQSDSPKYFFSKGDYEKTQQILT